MMSKSESHPALVERLSRQSVAKHYDAYLDVDWDAPEHRIDAADPRFVLRPEEPLGATAWYQALPAADQAHLGLHLVANAMKTGFQFESVLKRGLLEFAANLSDDAPELRYVYHEVIEEAQHSLMFQEFLRRARAAGDFTTPGIVGVLGLMPRHVANLARRFPELFFVFVIAGEDPIDHVQRRVMAARDDVHPLLARIMQIHITEEARHLAFARSWLREHVSRMSPAGRLRLAVVAPLVLGAMAHVMLRPSPHVVAAHKIPKHVVAEAYGRGSRVQRERVAEALRKPRELLTDLDLVGPRTMRLWQTLGIWDARA